MNKTNKNEPLLNVRNLNKRFISKHGVHTAVNNVSFQVRKGEILGLIGQSGSGKSTVANALMRLLKDVNGVVTLGGKVVSGKLSRKNQKSFYRNVQMIFQDPHTALNEKRNVFSTIAEPLLTHKIVSKEAKEFLRTEKDVQTSWNLTLNLTFFKKEFENNEFITKQRIVALENIAKNIQEFEVKVFANDDEVNAAYDTLTSMYFDEVISSKNRCLTKTVETTNFLLDFYNQARQKVAARELPVAELGLIDAQHNLVEYKESFDDIKIDKKIAIVKREQQKEIIEQIKETKNIIVAFIKDKKSSIKSTRALAQVARTINEHETHIIEIWKLKLHKEALQKLKDKKLIIPKEMLYEFESKLANLSTDHEVIELLNSYEAKFVALTNEYKAEMTFSTEKVITKLNERKGKDVVADPNHIEELEIAVAQAQKAYDIEKENVLKIFASEQEKLKAKTAEASHELHEHHIIALRTKIKSEFEKKLHLIAIQFKNKQLIHSKKLQVQQKVSRVKAYDVEEKQLLRSLKRIKTVYQINKSHAFVRYFIVKHLLLQKKIIDALVQVGLKPEHAYRYPHEFSGGQKQRINIARALIMEPQLIIADEPIASLDISIQAQVINILIDLVKQKGISMIFIGHDLSVIQYLADSILVMHLGRVVEKGFVEPIFNNPLHPYTKSLFASIPKVSTANEPFKSTLVDLSYIHEYEANKPSYKIVAKDHLLLANDEQLKWWANISSASNYSTDIYHGQKIASHVAENVEEELGEELVTQELVTKNEYQKPKKVSNKKQTTNKLVKKVKNKKEVAPKIAVKLTVNKSPISKVTDKKVTKKQVVTKALESKKIVKKTASKKSAKSKVKTVTPTKVKTTKKAK